jgi:formylglycine-generating enzyme required for sulfatase activity
VSSGLVASLLTGFGLLAAALATAPSAVAQSAPQPGAIVRDSIPDTLIGFDLVMVPGGTSTIDSPTGLRTITVRPLLVARTEVTWDMYDVYMHRLDGPREPGVVDAVARPSMPYAVPDYDWGHSGYAAISIAYTAAKTFAEWLSAKTGHRYRLPTEDEWLHIATLAAGPGQLTPERVDAVAWHRGNSERTTHPVASRKPDALGLHDLFGNAAEWVVSADANPVTRGGSFRDDPATLGPSARAPQTPQWTERDPQLPSSRWWLTDAPFVGFRLVRDP